MTERPTPAGKAAIQAGVSCNRRGDAPGTGSAPRARSAVANVAAARLNVKPKHERLTGGEQQKRERSVSAANVFSLSHKNVDVVT